MDENTYIMLQLDNKANEKLPPTIQFWSENSIELINYMKYAWKSNYVYKNQALSDIEIVVTSMKVKETVSNSILPDHFY